jgi:glycosyltransferase 2 family protein
MKNVVKLIKQGLAFTIKLCIAAGLIYWLVRSNRLDIRALTHIDLDFRAVTLIIIGAVGVFVGQWIMAIRLQILLGCFALRPVFSRILGVTLIGSFCSVLLPGLVGGDAVRMIYLFQDATGRRSHAMAAVLIDRIIGLYSLFLLGTFALGIAWMTGRLPVWSQVFLVCPIVVVGSTIGLSIVQWKGFQRWRLFVFAMERLPEKLQNLLRALPVCVRNPWVLTTTIGLSLINHALVIVTFVLAGFLLHDSVSAFTHFILSPLATVLNAVSLTPGGIGLTEGAFSFLYEHINVSSGATIGLLGRFIQYLTFVVSGGIAFLFVRMSARHSKPVQLACPTSGGMTNK